MAQHDQTKLMQAPSAGASDAAQETRHDALMSDFQDRTLAVIAAEIRVRKVKTGRDAIEVGALLTEAKAQLGHGRWLPWLQQEFGYSPRTAQNYLRAFKFARDQENVAHLNLSPAILYRLAGTRQQGKPPKIAPPSQPPGS